MRTLVVVLVALTGAAACGKKKSESKPAPKEPAADMPALHSHQRVKAQRTGEPRPQPQLTVSVDGKPVEMKAAFVTPRPDGAFDLLVTSVPADCAWATGDMRMMEDGEEDFDAILAKQLQPDGSFAWAMQQASYGGNTRAGMPGTVKVEGDGAAGASTKLTLALELESGGFGGEAAKKLKVDGTVDALGCPPGAPKGDAAKPPPPAQPGNLTVAGQKVAIAGAALRQKDGDSELVLTTGAITCDSFPFPDGKSNLIVGLGFHGADLFSVDLRGDWISGQQQTQVFDKGKVSAAPITAPDGAATVDITLGGKTEVMGYPVALDGKVTALVCKP